MKKIFTYTKREEELINKQLGYSEKQLNNYNSNPFLLYRYKINGALTKMLFAILLRKKCCHCGNKLIGLKKYTYVGMRHAPTATSGDYQKTYFVSFHLYCENCKKGNRFKSKE